MKTLAPETRFLGVVAAYRDVEHAKWRTVVAVKPSQQQQITITAGPLSVEAVATP